MDLMEDTIKMAPSGSGCELYLVFISTETELNRRWSLSWFSLWSSDIRAGVEVKVCQWLSLYDEWTWSQLQLMGWASSPSQNCDGSLKEDLKHRVLDISFRPEDCCGGWFSRPGHWTTSDWPRAFTFFKGYLKWWMSPCCFVEDPHTHTVFRLVTACLLKGNRWIERLLLLCLSSLHSSDKDLSLLVFKKPHRAVVRDGDQQESRPLISDLYNKGMSTVTSLRCWISIAGLHQEYR